MAADPEAQPVVPWLDLLAELHQAVAVRQEELRPVAAEHQQLAQPPDQYPWGRQS